MDVAANKRVCNLEYEIIGTMNLQGTSYFKNH